MVTAIQRKNLLQMLVMLFALIGMSLSVIGEASSHGAAELAAPTTLAPESRARALAPTAAVRMRNGVQSPGSDGGGLAGASGERAVLAPAVRAVLVDRCVFGCHVAPATWLTVGKRSRARAVGVLHACPASPALALPLSV